MSDSAGMDIGEEARKGADACLAEAAEQLRSHGLEVESHCMRQEPADALIEVAETTEASLVVVGSEGMHGSAGSSSEASPTAPHTTRPAR